MRTKVPFGPILFASFVGVFSGFYIFNPTYFVSYQNKYGKKKLNEEDQQNLTVKEDEKSCQ